MAYPTGDEILEDLPAGTAVTEERAQSFVDAAIARLGECHAPDALPENATTRHLVWQMAFARSLKHHYMKGEGNLEVPAAEEEIDRAETAFDVYCERISLPAEELDTEAQSGVAYIGRLR